MKQRFSLFLYIVCLIFVASGANAQLVGDNVFLQGRYLEVGIAPNGSWGNTVPIPAGYHTNPFPFSTFYYPDPITGSTPPDTTALDFSYDVGHDGWTTGADPLYGPYFMPGTPFDGWAIQVNGVRSDAFFTNGGFGPAGTTLTGTNVGYTNAGGVISGIWQGSVGTGGALSIRQTTRVDTLASWAVVTTVLKNTTGAPLPGVYYWVSADPDDDEVINSGDYSTDNHIVYQNDGDHRVEVISRPHTLHLAAVSGLATKDCRAKAMIYESWSQYPSESAGNSLDLVYSGQATGLGVNTFTLDTTTVDQDWAYGLIYNLGTIAANDSAVISYSWIFTDSTAVDSAFPDPQLVVNGDTARPQLPAPAPVYDTFVSCSHVGVNAVTVNVLHGNDKNWTKGQWTWSPSTGLAATTGVNNVITLSALGGPTTFTVTGTDTANNNCSHALFYLTVYPCFSASSDAPVCLNDTLKLYSHGDSTGATYVWYGPNGFLSSGQNTFRTGLTMADTGVYHVVRIVGTVRDTTATHVLLTPLPVASLASNGPVCSGVGDTLNLSATQYSAGETFQWTGPGGYSSTAQNPSIIAPSSLVGTGIYTLVTSFNGCNDTTTITVAVDSTPAVPLARSNAPICSRNDTLRLNGSDGTPGVTYAWAGPNGFTSTLTNPVILPNLSIAATGIYSITAILTTPDGLACKSSNTINILVDSTPYLPLLGSNSPVCSGNPLLLTASSTAGAGYTWIGPNGFTSTAQNPTIASPATLATGVYSVTATAVYAGISSGCTSDAATISIVVDSTPVTPVATSNSPGAPGGVICQSDTLRLMATDATAGVSYSWTGPFGFTSTDQNPLMLNTGTNATGIFTVTATLGGCSATAVTSVTITPTPPLTATNNGPLCTGVGDTMLLQAFSTPGATYSWAGPYTFSSLNQNPYRTPVIYEYGGVYQVTAFYNGCPSATVNDTVVVRQTPEPPIVPWLTYCLNYAAFPLQAMGDSILWSATNSPTDTGTLIPPVPSTSNVGVSWFYTSQTLMGCTSYKDSIKVTVNPKPTVTVSNDTGVCPHDTVVLTAVDRDPVARYHWAPYLYITDTSSAAITARPETDVTYTVVATNEFGCTDTAHVKVTVQAAAVLNLGDSVTLYPGESYQLPTQTNCSIFAWFPPAGLSDAHISNPVATPQVSTVYKVQGTTAWGCTTESSISIYLNADALLMLPNAFAPGSGANDEFKIIKRGIVDLQYFRIFDRWGVKVFETNDINQGWDGTFKGKPQPFGVYIYEVGGTTNIGTHVEKHGNVTLLR